MKPSTALFSHPSGFALAVRDQPSVYRVPNDGYLLYDAEILIKLGSLWTIGSSSKIST